MIKFIKTIGGLVLDFFIYALLISGVVFLFGILSAILYMPAWFGAGVIGAAAAGLAVANQISRLSARTPGEHADRKGDKHVRN